MIIVSTVIIALVFISSQNLIYTSASFCNPEIDKELQLCEKPKCLFEKCVNGLREYNYSVSVKRKTSSMCYGLTAMVGMQCGKILANYSPKKLEDFCASAKNTAPFGCRDQKNEIVLDLFGSRAPKKKACVVKAKVFLRPCGGATVSGTTTQKPSPAPTSPPVDQIIASSLRFSKKIVMCEPLKFETSYLGCNDKEDGYFKRKVSLRSAKDKSCKNVMLDAKVFCTRKRCPPTDEKCVDGYLHKVRYEMEQSVCVPYFKLDIC